jgi:hypothetical protein
MLTIILILCLIQNVLSGGLFLRSDNTINTIHNFVQQNRLTNCYWQDNAAYLTLKCWRDEKIVEAYVEILYDSKVI